MSDAPISCGLKSSCLARAKSTEETKSNGKKKVSKKKMFPYKGRVK